MLLIIILAGIVIAKLMIDNFKMKLEISALKFIIGIILVIIIIGVIL